MDQDRAGGGREDQHGRAGTQCRGHEALAPSRLGQGPGRRQGEMDRRQAGVHHHRPGGVVAGDPAVAARHGGGLAEGLIGEGDGDVERQEPPDEAVEIEPGQRAAEDWGWPG